MIDRVDESTGIYHILPIGMEQRLIEIAEHLRDHRFVFRRLHLFVFPPYLHGHFSLTEKGSQIPVVVRNESRYICFYFPIICRAVSHAACGKEGDTFSMQSGKIVQNLHTGRTAVCPESDEIDIGRAFFKAGIQSFDVF